MGPGSNEPPTLLSPCDAPIICLVTDPLAHVEIEKQRVTFESQPFTIFCEVERS